MKSKWKLKSEGSGGSKWRPEAKANKNKNPQRNFFLGLFSQPSFACDYGSALSLQRGNRGSKGASQKQGRCATARAPPGLNSEVSKC